MRLNKAIAAAGICSRRKADELIEKGAVRINGEAVTTPGVQVDPEKDRIEVNGRLLEIRTDPQEYSYVLLHKPIRTVTTSSDPQGRKTVMDLLSAEMKKNRVVPVGRLDYFSEGILLLTNDGDLTYRLTHPKWHQPKVYRVQVRGGVDERSLQAMRSGMRLAEGEKLAPVQVRVLESVDRDTVLEMTLIQGVNRQIRRMCRDLGLTVIKLKRVQFGSLTLKGLAPGKWRSLTAQEVEMLRNSADLNK